MVLPTLMPPETEVKPEGTEKPRKLRLRRGSMVDIREVARNLGGEVEEVITLPGLNPLSKDVVEETKLPDKVKATKNTNQEEDVLQEAHPDSPLNREERLIKGILHQAEAHNVSQKGAVSAEFCTFPMNDQRDKARS